MRVLDLRLPLAAAPREGDEELERRGTGFHRLAARSVPQPDILGGEEDLGLDDAAGGAELPPEVVAQVEDALASALGAMEQELEAAIPELDLSVEREGEEELGGEEDLGGDEELADLGGEEELAPEDDLGGDDLGGDEELAPEDELVERIARKVALRLRNAVKK